MINKVILIGNLGQSPELRYTQSGDAVCNLSIATTEKWKDRNGEQQERTEWHRVIAWKKLAELCGQYLHKGSKVYVEGSLQTRKWQDSNGNERYTTEINANVVKFLDGFGVNSESSGNNAQTPSQHSIPGVGDDVPF